MITPLQRWDVTTLPVLPSADAVVLPGMVIPHHGTLYLGSLVESGIARLPLPTG
jgi:hypothetical protein